MTKVAASKERVISGQVTGFLPVNSASDNVSHLLIILIRKMLGLIWIQLFDTLKVFLKEFFEKVNCEGNHQTNKILEKITQRSKSKPLKHQSR